MSNSNISTLGRFSSQMLTYYGTQRTVKTVAGDTANTFKYSQGPTTFPAPGSVSQGTLGNGVVGSYSADQYNRTKCYFLSRGASKLYADTMVALTIDMASALNTSPQAFLEKVNPSGKLTLSAESYRAFNVLRDLGHQVGNSTTAINRTSKQFREIRA